MQFYSDRIMFAVRSSLPNALSKFKRPVFGLALGIFADKWRQALKSYNQRMLTTSFSRQFMVEIIISNI